MLPTELSYVTKFVPLAEDAVFINLKSLSKEVLLYISRLLSSLINFQFCTVPSLISNSFRLKLAFAEESVTFRVRPSFIFRFNVSFSAKIKLSGENFCPVGIVLSLRFKVEPFSKFTLPPVVKIFDVSELATCNSPPFLT